MVDISDIKNLAKYKHIVIQCHDIPDADSICSGFALQCYLRSLGADPALVYSGFAQITKPSLIMMIDMLKIDIDYVQEISQETDLLITVDCQRGAGNVRKLEIPETADFAVIDHHRAEITEDVNCVIRSNLASCATLVWDLLCKENFVLDDRLRNALFYGLFTDTNGLAELRHPLDRDLAELPNDTGMIRKLKNAAITAEELDIVGRALGARKTFDTIGLLRADPCDANLLGFTSDIAQQVAQMDCCVVYSPQRFGIKLSIRCSAREIMASEIAGFLCQEAGSGGGNVEKAGGFIGLDKLKEKYPDIDPIEYLENRIKIYLENYDLVYAGNNDIDFASMPLYKKLPRPVGYATSTDIFPAKTKITIRTLEGDVDTITADNICLMIGVQGEVWPIKRERLETSYNLIDEPYRENAEYTPSIINRLSGDRKEILPFAKVCIPSAQKTVRAKKLVKDTKVFTSWDTEKYYFGTVNDYLVANDDSYDDCYIVRSDVFLETYEACNG